MTPFLLLPRLRVAALSRKRFKSKAKHVRNHRTKEMQERLKRLTTQMEEISEQQKRIREGQRQVKENFLAIESECEKLKEETRFIIQQSARTQIKLALMFRILKARETGDPDTAANLTKMLRKIEGREQERKLRVAPRG